MTKTKKGKKHADYSLKTRSRPSKLSNKIDWGFMTEFFKIRTPSSGETNGHYCVAQYLNRLGYETLVDTFGTLVIQVGKHVEGRYTVLVDTHFDEIGYSILDFDESGFLYFKPMGGSDREITPGIPVWIHTRNGLVKGVIGNKSIHLKNDDGPEYDAWSKMFIDIGTTSREESMRLVEKGDLVTADEEIHWLGKNRLAGRAMDNHVSCFMSLQLLRLLKNENIKLDYNLYFSFTIQEETGLHGGKHMASRIKPDLAIVVDLDVSTDHPGIPSYENSDIRIGNGVVVSSGNLSFSRLEQMIYGLAKKMNIQTQKLTSSPGGTNYSAMYNKGIPGIMLGVSGRYLHSSITTVDIFDIQQCIFLLFELIKKVGGLKNDVIPYLKKFDQKNSKIKECGITKKSLTVAEGIKRLMDNK